MRKSLLKWFLNKGSRYFWNKIILKGRNGKEECLAKNIVGVPNDSVLMFEQIFKNKSTQSQFISGNYCEPGTSGCESGNSGIIRILRVCFRILRAWFCHRGSTNVLNLSLSLTNPYHSLSLPSALSPSRSHSFPPNPRAQTLSQFDLKAKGASNRRGGPSTPRAPPWGAVDSKFLAGERTHPRYLN